jgi:hypothetical protein
MAISFQGSRRGLWNAGVYRRKDIISLLGRSGDFCNAGIHKRPHHIPLENECRYLKFWSLEKTSQLIFGFRRWRRRHHILPGKKGWLLKTLESGKDITISLQVGMAGICDSKVWRGHHHLPLGRDGWPL